MTPEEKAAGRAKIKSKIEKVEAKIARITADIEEQKTPPKQDTQGSEVGSQEPVTNVPELVLKLEDAEAELLTLRTKYNAYAGRRRNTKSRRRRRH